jgi:hypothetical protein
MFRRLVNRFFLWAPPSALATYLVILGVAATAAPVNADAKIFLDNQIKMLRAVSNSPYLAAWIFGLLAFWLVVYLWSLEWGAPRGASMDQPTLIVWVVEKIRRFFTKDLQAQSEPDASLGMEVVRADPPIAPRPRAKGYELTDENLDGLERVANALAEGIINRPDPIGDALRRMADRPPLPPKRDKSVGEAILYALKGRWGLDFANFDPRQDSHDVETIKWQFEEMAEDGRIQVWGSDSCVEGRYTKIDPSEWKHLKIEWQSLTEGRPRTTEKEGTGPTTEPHYNLMVNQAQIEREFPPNQTAPPSVPQASRPRMGTPGAFVRGIDEAQTVAGVEIHNYGSSTAQNVRVRSLCAIMPTRPPPPVQFDKSNSLGPCEPGHTQNIRFPFMAPVKSETVARFDRNDGFGLYLIMEADYENDDGKRFRREIAYYLDPMAEQTDKGLQMSVCAEGNRDIEVTQV